MQRRLDGVGGIHGLMAVKHCLAELDAVKSHRLCAPSVHNCLQDLTVSLSITGRASMCLVLLHESMQYALDLKGYGTIRM